MDIEKLINLQTENEFLDYKQKVDCQYNKIDFLRDVMAFSNNSFEGDKYIIYGIKQTSDGIDIVGLENYDYGDDADYQKLVSDKIEPQINVEFVKYTYQQKKILVVRIVANASLRPFVVKGKYTQGEKTLEIGESWIRVGSSKRRMTRSDFETIYVSRRSPLGLKLRDSELFVDDRGVAQLEFLITNMSDIERVFTEVFLAIKEHNGKRLTILKMLRFISNDCIQEGSFYHDLALNIPRKSEIHGIAEFAFSSSQAVIVGLSEYGDSEENYIFEIKFRYDIDQEYQYAFNDCTIFARDGVLRKVQGLARKSRDGKKK